jgi:hypothetical protein
LKKEVDPDIFITYLEGLRATMGDMESFITDKQFIMHVMNNLNKGYEKTVKNQEKLINDKNDPLTIEQMREDLSLKHERLYGTDDNREFESDDDEEHALYAGAGRWKGKCKSCGKQGHKAVDCRSNGAGANKATTSKGGGAGKRFAGKCHYCQKTGHRASNCFKKKRDQGGEPANVTKDKACGKEEETADVVLMTIDEEEASYPMCEPCNSPSEAVSYSVYLNAKNVECLTCQDFESNEVKDWCGKGLCLTQVKEDNHNDDNSSRFFSMLSLMQKEDNCAEEDSKQYYEENRDHDFAFATNDPSKDMLKYLRKVAIDKGIREPNIDSWANSVETKLNVIQVRTPRDVVTNIITLNKQLNHCGQSMFHTRTLNVMACIGVELLCSTEESNDTALIAFELPSNSDDEHDDYGDIDFFYNWSSTDDWSEEQKQNDEDSDDDSGELCFQMQDDTKLTDYKMNQNTWLGDSASSTHMGFSDEGMAAVEIINYPVRIGNGKALTATKIGKRHITIIQKDGSTQDTILSQYNLFSISESLQNGWNISNKGVEIKFSKGKTEIVFDRIIKASKGLVVGVEILSRTDAMAHIMLDRGKSIDMNILHTALGHLSQEVTKKTAEYYDLKITGTFKPCSDCQTAKSKQNTVTKESETRSTIPGERLFINTSSVKAKSFGNSKFWLLVVDDCTDVAWSAFLSKKSNQVDQLITLIKELA